MSDTEIRVTSATGGRKGQKLQRYDLLPAEPLRRLAEHAGTRVYGQRRGSYHRMMDRAWRFWGGEEVDQETDWTNLIYAAFEALRIVQPDWQPPAWVLNDLSGGARYDRIPPDALRQLAEHFGRGAEKYTERDEQGNITHDGGDNWRLGYDWRLTFAAANRHAEQWRAGETHDPETGSHHLIAFAWHMLVLDEFTRINLGGDTRYCTKVRRWLEAEEKHNSPFARVGLTVETHRQLNAREAMDVWAQGGPAPTLDQWEEWSTPTRGPRVVDALGDNERDAHSWRDRDGDEWAWRQQCWHFRRGEPGADWIPLGTGGTFGSHFGPFTEVLA